MKKKTGLILGGVVLFSLVLAVGLVMAATSEEGTASASVTVNAFVDITITDTGSDGINFGSLDLNTNNNPDDDQVDNAAVTPAATVTREATSNTDILVRLKGTDFTGGAGTIAVTNVDYDDEGFVNEGTDTGTYTQETMQNAYPSTSGTDDPWATLDSGNPTVKIWFWLDVPSSQAAGSYSSTFSFEGNSV